MSKRILLLIGLLILAFIEIQKIFPRFQPQLEITKVATTSSEISEGDLATVARVFDGDTIELTDGRRVRYIGIDAPEVAHENRQAECFGNSAKEENQRIVNGKAVRLIKDISNVDLYGRLLRYVYVDNIFVNEQLVANGFARAWNVPPDEQHKGKLFTVQQKAKESDQGLWQVCKK